MEVSPLNPLVYAPPAQQANPLVSDGTSSVAPDPNDYTNKYNTELSPSDEAKFQTWAAQNGRQSDTYDYDLRGAWKANANAATNGHLPDTWKKPNHPTFSDQSQYHGVDGNQGGSWSGGNGQPWSFTPGTTNLRLYSPSEMQGYFQRVEPDSTLILPR